MSKFKEDVAEEVIDLTAKRAIGATFWRSTTVISRTIPSTFAAAIDITDVSTNGELEIEDVILKTTDGLSGGATLKIVSDNAVGTTVIMAVPVTQLGSLATIDLESARLRELLANQDDGGLVSTVNRNARTILEDGKKIQLVGQGAFTDNGTMKIYIKFRRVANFADINIANA